MLKKKVKKVFCVCYTGRVSSIISTQKIEIPGCLDTIKLSREKTSRFQGFRVKKKVRHFQFPVYLLWFGISPNSCISTRYTGYTP